MVNFVSYKIDCYVQEFQPIGKDKTMVVSNEVHRYLGDVVAGGRTNIGHVTAPTTQATVRISFRQVEVTRAADVATVALHIILAK